MIVLYIVISTAMSVVRGEAAALAAAQRAGSGARIWGVTCPQAHKDGWVNPAKCELLELEPYTVTHLKVKDGKPALVVETRPSPFVAPSCGADSCTSLPR